MEDKKKKVVEVIKEKVVEDVKSKAVEAVDDKLSGAIDVISSLTSDVTSGISNAASAFDVAEGIVTVHHAKFSGLHLTSVTGIGIDYKVTMKWKELNPTFTHTSEIVNTKSEIVDFDTEHDVHFQVQAIVLSCIPFFKRPLSTKSVVNQY